MFSCCRCESYCRYRKWLVSVGPQWLWKRWTHRIHVHVDLCLISFNLRIKICQLCWKEIMVYIFFFKFVLFFVISVLVSFCVFIDVLSLNLIFFSSVFQLITRRRFQQIDVLEGINVLISISGKETLSTY